jgi:histidinol dehydrogenase
MGFRVKTRVLSQLSHDEVAQLKRRAETNIEGVIADARLIVEQVKASGDDAILAHLEAFDSVKLTAPELKVSDPEFEEAEQKLDPAVKTAINQAANNITKFHKEQMPSKLWFAELESGILAGEKITPMEKVGLYVPRGKGTFPSVMLMLTIPATVAQVEKVVVCTPPNPDGSVDGASLFAANLVGVKDIYKVGGASAIAGMAYGTPTVPKVDKIVGPGNPYVAAAKWLLYGTVDVGLPAGPSEAIILADDSANPQKVALDLLIEAEHGPDSASTLVTPSRPVADAVATLIPTLVGKLPQPRREYCETVLSGYGGILITDTLEAAIDFVNDYAPEHLEVHVKEPLAILEQLQNAGEIMLGEHTPISISNYCLGTNAVLPTGARAKTYSSVSVFSFLKRTSVSYLTAEGFDRLQQTTRTLADYEGFPAHAMAIEQRE